MVAIALQSHERMSAVTARFALGDVPSAETARPVLWLLPLRLLGFLGFQAAAFAVLGAAGQEDSWFAAAKWWPFAAVATNFLCIAVVRHLVRSEGGRYRDFFVIERVHTRRDLLTLLALLVVAGPVGWLPGAALAVDLFGDLQAPHAMMMQALPAWAFWAAIAAFPVTTALSELPLYWGLAYSRLTERWGSRALAVLCVGFWHGAQHATLPLLFDGRFVLWRLLMFLPFALSLGAVLAWRPRLMPYVVAVHLLIDLLTVAMIPIAH
jgi:hypothetical protein